MIERLHWSDILALNHLHTFQTHEIAALQDNALHKGTLRQLIQPWKFILFENFFLNVEISHTINPFLIIYCLNISWL